MKIILKVICKCGEELKMISGSISDSESTIIFKNCDKCLLTAYEDGYVSGIERKDLK